MAEKTDTAGPQHQAMEHTPWPVPAALRDLAARTAARVGGPAADLVEGCLTNTWTTSMSWAEGADGPEDREAFVVTGDIPAMWLRDSTAQVRPYLAVARDPEVGDALAAVSRRQIRYVLTDPYANAFNREADHAHGYPTDEPAPGPWVWEQKYELDSLCAPLHLGYALWKAAGRTDHLDADFHEAARRTLALWRTEQDHNAASPYRFVREDPSCPDDTLPGEDGRGAPAARTGMTWSAFRPSDDRCEYGYLVPSNALASAGLHGLAEIADAVLADAELAAEARALAEEIDAGMLKHAVVDGVLAYEVDGLGGVLLADDANLPSLLALPLTGWCAEDDPLYTATRARVLSDANPYHYRGEFAEGVGSPHTPPRHVWPLALAATGLTGTDEEAARALDTLAATTAGTGLMHESFHVDDPAVFTRPWFGWANAMFSELALRIAGEGVRQYFPRHPRATR